MGEKTGSRQRIFACWTILVSCFFWYSYVGQCWKAAAVFNERLLSSNTRAVLLRATVYPKPKVGKTTSTVAYSPSGIHEPTCFRLTINQSFKRPPNPETELWREGEAVGCALPDCGGRVVMLLNDVCFVEMVDSTLPQVGCTPGRRAKRR